MYDNVFEEIIMDIPLALGNTVDTITYVDVNLLHDLLSGKAVIGILHMLNKIPIDRYSKKQNTVEMSTFSSEIVTARISTDQIIDLHLTLCYMGVPLSRSIMFGDNELVVKNSTIPTSRLAK